MKALKIWLAATLQNFFSVVLQTSSRSYQTAPKRKILVLTSSIRTWATFLPSLPNRWCILSWPTSMSDYDVGGILSVRCISDIESTFYSTYWSCYLIGGLVLCHGKLTEKLIENETSNLLQIIVELQSTKKKILEKPMFFTELKKTYKQCLSKVEINCLDIQYCGDQRYSSVGLFVKELFAMGQLNDTLEEFLAFVPVLR